MSLSTRRAAPPASIARPPPPAPFPHRVLQPLMRLPFVRASFPATLIAPFRWPEHSITSELIASTWLPGSARMALPRSGAVQRAIVLDTSSMLPPPTMTPPPSMADVQSSTVHRMSTALPPRTPSPPAQAHRVLRLSTVGLCDGDVCCSRNISKEVRKHLQKPDSRCLRRYSRPNLLDQLA